MVVIISIFVPLATNMTVTESWKWWRQPHGGRRKYMLQHKSHDRILPCRMWRCGHSTGRGSRTDAVAACGAYAGQVNVTLPTRHLVLCSAVTPTYVQWHEILVSRTDFHQWPSRALLYVSTVGTMSCYTLFAFLSWHTDTVQCIPNRKQRTAISKLFIYFASFSFCTKPIKKPLLNKILLIIMLKISPGKKIILRKL